MYINENVTKRKEKEQILEIKQPIQPQERITILDVLRGFAILGILISNMPYFQSPQLYNNLLIEKVWTHALDPYIDMLYVVFIQGKFYTLFSFLFGVGFVIFMSRASQSVEKPKLLLSRRLFILLIIGLIHALLIWWGDILVTYAVLGFVLLLFTKTNPKWLLGIAVGLVAVYNLLIYFLVTVVSELGSESIIPTPTNDFSIELIRMRDSILHYGEGTFNEIIMQNINDWLYVSDSGIISGLFLILPMFLLGSYFGKRNIFGRLNDHAALFKKIWIWSLIAGLPLQMMKLWAYQYINEFTLSIHSFWYYVGITIGDPIMCFFYLTSIVILYQRQILKTLWINISRVGRMALSHYLFQSVICGFIFYNYGLGLYGKLGLGMGFIIALMIYIFQIWFSKFWFGKYRYGPVEWIWRMLTYGSKISISRGK
ncbi:DUF418 domain-containing protein [Chengkuizengella axinellae]|uniref:DUF418 domain-containing protein n=1 Tax=Chengkuizengella axinellae TaxID=3064388 RepID=A0ABT9IWG4_9BACL|nr:DUF418 domain-containing protein [Chengkuizengella sp. 2205SS18-9]MDP5273709.1 DUF418 domain-containing protein [Chengkuizengella sp. 2205SS18-9]